MPGTPAISPVGSDWKRRFFVPLAVVAVVMTATTIWGWLRPSPEEQVTRLDLSLGTVAPVADHGDVVISPDGSAFAVAGLVGGRQAIYVRRLGEAEFRLVPGTENGRFPSFSPDGRWLVFRRDSDNTLVKVALSGGEPLTLLDDDALVPSFPHWGEDGTIVFMSPHGVHRIPSAGGPPELINAPRGHPHMLPDGSGLFVSFLGIGIQYVDLAADTSWAVVPDGFHPSYVEPGILLYVTRNGGLVAVPFDRKSHTVSDTRRRVLDRVSATFGRRGYSVSRNGTLVQIEGLAFGESSQTQLVTVSMDGEVDTLRLPFASTRSPRFSPNGQTIAFEVQRGDGHDIYTYDLVTDARRQLTFEHDSDDPIWSPDGSSILFNLQDSPDVDGEDLVIKLVDNSGPMELVLTRPGAQVPRAWLADDRIVYTSDEFGTNDLFLLSLSGDSDPEPYLQAPWEEDEFALSPDGTIAAHTSTKTGGSAEVWLREFPKPQGEWRVSFGGGVWPRWSPDGRTLYFWRLGAGPDTPFAAEVIREDGVVVRDPKVVLALEIADGNWWDLHPNGKRFIVVVPGGGAAEFAGGSSARYVVVLNWFEELRERMGNE
ncbi:MAG: PD40 domain-containing protein [Deltaproteobacteria bacterium]|nr:PD40 domain-containing protein [Deltaproteobacteria bacterium]